MYYIMIQEYILIRTDLNLGKGKMAGQCSHASELLSYIILNQRMVNLQYWQNNVNIIRSLLLSNNDWKTQSIENIAFDWDEINTTYNEIGYKLLTQWHNENNLYRKIVCKIGSEAELFNYAKIARENHLPTIIIEDAGLTQLTQKEWTCCAFLIDLENNKCFADKLKNELKLL